MESDLITLIKTKTVELESQLSAKNWLEAIELDKERFLLLSKLSEAGEVTVDSENRIELFQQLLEGVHKDQCVVDSELDRCKVDMGEFGQQRKASSIYQDTASTR